MSDQADLGEAVLRLSTDDRDFIAGLFKAKEAAETVHKDIKTQFSEKFEHVGVHLFGHDLLQAVGITQGARPIIGALGLAVNKTSEAFGMAAGPIGLMVFGLTAVAAIGFKIFESHEKHAKSLEDLLKKQSEELGKTIELKDKLEAYERAVGHIPPRLEAFKKATMELFEAQVQLTGHTAGKAMSASLEKSAALEKEKALVEAQIKTQISALTMGQSVEAAVRSENQVRNQFAERLADIDIRMKKEHANYETIKQDVAAHAAGSANQAAQLEKLAKAAEKATEEQGQFASFMASQSAKLTELNKHESESKLEQNRLYYQHARQEMEIFYAREEALIKASAISQKMKDSQLEQLHAGHEKQKTATDQSENAKRVQIMANAMGIQSTFSASMASAGIKAFNNITDTASQNFAKMIVEGKSFTDAFKGFFTNMAESVISDIIKIIIKQQILLALEAVTGTLGSGRAMGFGAGLAARARGGPVAAGVPYKVGEEGEELFIPKQDGMIIAHDKIAGGSGAGASARGGGGNTSIAVNVTIYEAKDAEKIGEAIVRKIRGMGQIAFARAA